MFAILAIWKIPQWQVEPLQQQIDALKNQPKPAEPKAIATLEKSKLDAENQLDCYWFRESVACSCLPPFSFPGAP